MEKLKILVRLPNWLGDMVMATGAVGQLDHFFPGAELSFIVKKGLQDLLPYFPSSVHTFLFSKEQWPGLSGVVKFGRMMRQADRFDLFVSFPDSFSAALMGYASGASQRVGYRKEGREILLTHAFKKPVGRHRVREYAQLLERFTGKKSEGLAVTLTHSIPKEDYLVININSEASSRRLTIGKAAEIIGLARSRIECRILLIGAPSEQGFVEAALAAVPDRQNIESLAGKTSLGELAKTLAAARVVLTTDSGPAHLSNALGTQTVVLFGAGNENNTAPYNRDCVEVIRLGELSCEPCTSNVCLRFATPQCLERLDSVRIIETVAKKIEDGN